GVDDGVFHTSQHLNSFLHLCGITHGHGHGIVDHHHGHRRYQHLRASHRNDRGGTGCDTIDLHSHVVRIIHQHVIDLGSRYAVAAGAVDPDRDVSASAHQFLFKKLRRDVIVKPAFLGD